MNEPIRARLASFCGQKRVLAGSLIISLFGDMVLPRGGRIWMGSLIPVSYTHLDVYKRQTTR